MRRVAVFGCGYVGLCTAACIARLGNDCACYDTEQMKLRDLRDARIPFFEPGLSELVAEERAAGRLHFCAFSKEALLDAEIVFIAVGTPTGPTGEADLTYVRQCVMDIIENASGRLLIVNKSTVPVETADFVQRLIARYASLPERFSVASNPEFLREGSAIHDFMHPDRIVIGARDESAVEILRSLYEPLGAPIICVGLHTAEMIKYAANAFLATKISFINEIANLCEAVDADIDGVVAGIGADERIGRSYLEPGLGFGGSCLPKDVAALASVARAHAIEPTMLDATLSVNRRQVARAVRLIENVTGELLERELTVAGVAFKGGTDDLRESPAIVLVEALITRGARVTVYDPHAMTPLRAKFGDRVTYGADPYAAVEGSDALIVANDDRSLRTLAWDRIASALRSPNVIDLRNKIDRHAVASSGLRYAGMGRAALQAAS